MQWIKWTMATAACVLPSIARAEEPPAVEGKVNLKVQVQPVKEDEQKIFEIGGENSPLHLKIVKGTFPSQLLDEKEGHGVFVGGEISVTDPKEMAKVALQQMLGKVAHVKGSYLGVSATPPPPVLRKQLGFADGMGLVVDFVVPESPAAKAGLQQYDVLQKLEDQLIVNQEQFAVLVRSHKPGDEIKLTIIRDGKPQTLTAKLAEHEIEPLPEDGGEKEYWLDLKAPGPHPFAPGEHGVIKEWRANVFPFPSGPTKSVTWLEGDHSYSITTDNEGHKTYTVKDKDGKSLFQGPIDTPEQREKLSPEMKAKLDQLEKRMGGEFKRELKVEKEKSGEEK